MSLTFAQEREEIPCYHIIWSLTIVQTLTIRPKYEPFKLYLLIFKLFDTVYISKSY